MPQFEYLVKDTQGHDQTGVEEAQDAKALVENLRRQGYLIIRINEVKKQQFFSMGFGKKGPRAKGGRRPEI